MQLYIENLACKIIIIDVDSNATIKKVKQEIEAQTGLSTQSQIIYLSGNELKNNTTLEDHNIQKDSHLHLSSR